MRRSESWASDRARAAPIMAMLTFALHSSKNGKHCYSNVQLAHLKCNVQRGNNSIPYVARKCSFGLALLWNWKWYLTRNDLRDSTFGLFALLRLDLSTTLSTYLSTNGPKSIPNVLSAYYQCIILHSYPHDIHRMF